MEDRLLTPTDVAEILGVPAGTLARWRYMGSGPAYLRVGRHVRYRSADVRGWLDSMRHVGGDVITLEPTAERRGLAPSERGRE